MPGLPDPVSPEEYKNRGDIEISTSSVTCSSLLVQGISDEMDQVLRTNEPLRVAFLNCVDDDGYWGEDSYLTDVRTGFTYKVEHFRSGELTKEEIRIYAARVYAAKVKELESWVANHALRVMRLTEMQAGWQ